MTLAYNYASGTNPYIPNLNTTAQGGLMVEFSRSPDSFDLNKYTQLQQVIVMAGKYWRFDQNAMARVNTSDGAQFDWADGADRPSQNIYQGFDMPAYNCQRLNFQFLLGDLATYHAQTAGGVDLVAVNSRTAAGACMVQRTRKALARVMDTTVMPYFNLNTGASGNFSAPTQGLPAGLTQGNYWDAGKIPAAGTPNPANAQITYFRSGVNFILSQICQLSNNAVKPKDIQIVMGPDTAQALAQSTEMLDYLKQSQYALPSLQQDDTFGLYGLPSKLFGSSRIIVEATSYITSHPFGSNTPTRGYAIPYGSILFLSRPGSIEGSPMSYSTVMGFFFEEMSVETFDKPEHRYVQGNIVDNYDYQITAPITGFWVQKAITGS